MLTNKTVSFGPYKFIIKHLKYNKENRWSVIEYIGKVSSLQHIGQGAENIELEGIIYANNTNGINQLNNMKRVKKDEEYHTLVDNLGNVLGQFVITRLEEKQTYFFPNGLPKKVEFSLSLKRYV